MIFETLLSTTNPDGSVNFAPAGAQFEDNGVRLVLYRGSHSHANLLRTDIGAIHIIDDINVFMEATIGDPTLPVKRSETYGIYVYHDACSYYILNVIEKIEKEIKTVFYGRIIESEHLRGCEGFNRARNALLDLAVHTSRIGISYSKEQVWKELTEKKKLITTTGGEKEFEALRNLEAYLENGYGKNKQ